MGLTTGSIRASWFSTKSVIITLVFIGLLATNVMTLASSKVYDALFGVLESVASASTLQNSKAVQQRKMTKTLHERGKRIKAMYAKNKKAIANAGQLSGNISRRIMKNIGLNLSAIPAESIPVVGVVTVIGITAMDIADACANMRDMDEMMSVLDSTGYSRYTTKVCGMKVPGMDHRSEWDSFKEKLGGTISVLIDD